MKALFCILPLSFLLSSCSKSLSAAAGTSAGYLSAFRSGTPTSYFYKGSQLVGVSPISTGKSTHTTPPGRFKISQKSADHKSSLYGVIRDKATGLIVNSDADTRKHRAKAGQVFENAPMPYFMRFNSGIGMHVGHLPGYAASHGCVRMPEEMAVKFFENVKIGTPVIVK